MTFMQVVAIPILAVVILLVTGCESRDKNNSFVESSGSDRAHCDVSLVTVELLHRKLLFAVPGSVTVELFGTFTRTSFMGMHAPGPVSTGWTLYEREGAGDGSGAGPDLDDSPLRPFLIMRVADVNGPDNVVWLDVDGGVIGIEIDWASAGNSPDTFLPEVDATIADFLAHVAAIRLPS